MTAPLAALMPWVRLPTRLASAEIGFDLAGPTLVLGSAPTSRAPAGYHADWRLITVNASQIVGEDLGLPAPDVAVLRHGLLVGIDSQDHYKRKLLAGRRAKHLIVPIWPRPLTPLAEGGKRFNYSYETLTALSKWQLAHIIWRLCGAYVATSRGWQRRISTGAFAIFVARYLGASPIVLSGFSFSTSGHAYDDRNARRHHVDADAALIRLALRSGVPLFAADPDFARESGVPIWNG